MNGNNWVLKEALHRDAVSAAGRAPARIKCLGGSAAPAQGTAASIHYLKAVDEAAVPARRVVAADAMARFCMRRLKIPTVKIGWYVLCSSSERGARPLGPRPTKAFVELAPVPRIWLRTDQKKFELMLAVAHECHHIWLERERAQGKYATLNADDRENSASAFAMLTFRDFQEVFHYGPGD